MPTTHAIGIDLGTTYSAVAQVDLNGRTTMVRNAQGDVLTPSVVLFEDSEIVVGKEAKKAADQFPDRVAECVKRDMGNATFSKAIRGEFLPPEVIQSCILRKLKNDAVAALGADIKAVVTVPAYFDEPRRKATADAGEMAGLDVLDIVNEPTAAALAFGETLGYLDPRGEPLQDQTVLVYDLGGGTFDVTVVELKPGNLRTLATDGDVRLGGRDWDARLCDHLAEAFLEEHGQDPRENPAGHARLMRTAEESKHTLSARDRANAHVTYQGKSSDVTVTREQFVLLTEDLLERTSHTVRGVLNSANVTWKQVSHVLLVGGSTRMPMVSELLKSVSGLTPDRNVHPDEAVARGAAIYAGYLISLDKKSGGPGPKFSVTDVNSHSLGIEGVDLSTSRKENVILIRRNTPLPARSTEKFVTKSAGQQSVVVQVLEGESKNPAQCSPVGRAVMRKLPAGLPKGWPVEVTYEYAANGRLSVRAKMPGTASDVSIELEREKGLTDDRLARWKVVVSSDRGFDAFEAMIDDVLNMESPEGESSAPRPPREQAVPVPAANRPSPSSAPPASAPRLGMPSREAEQKNATLDDELLFGDQPLAHEKPVATKDPRVATAMETRSPIVTPAAASAASTLAANVPAAPPARVSAVRSASRNSRNQARAVVINILGFLLTSILGLAAGYYIVSIVKPDSEILKYKLPFFSKSDPEPTTTPTPESGSK